MNKTNKILIGIATFFILAIGFLIAAPFIFKDRIIEAIRNEANNNLNAKVYFDNNIGISILRSFPNLTLTLNEVSVANIDSFAGDTLFYAPVMRTTVDIMSIIRGDDIEVISFELERPNIHLKVLENGMVNWDVTLPSDEVADTSAEEMKFNLQRYSIKNGNLVYDDRESKFLMRLTDFDHNGDGDFTLNLFNLNTYTHARNLTMAYDGMTYLDRVNAEMDAVLEIDNENYKYTFKDNELRLNELFLTFDGFVAMPGETIDMDITFNSVRTDFKNILSLIPAVYTSDFNDLRSEGQMDFAGYIRGAYGENSFPAYNVDLKVRNGMFQYPDLPSAVRDVYVDANISSPDGDLVNIDVPQFAMNMAGQPFGAKMHVKDAMNNPHVDASVNGKIILDEIKNFLYLEPGTSVSGVVDTDLRLKGLIADLENERYENFDADGRVHLTNIAYTSADLPYRVDVAVAELLFNPRNVNLKDLQAKVGNSDFHANGTLDNLISYMFSDQVLKGTLNLNSNLIDLNQLMTSTEPTTTQTSTSSMEAIELPANIDFTMSASANRVLYDNLDLTNVKGIVTLRDQKAHLMNFSMGMLDGEVLANGTYDSKNPSNPKAYFDLDIRNMSIKSTFDNFVSVKQFVPIASQITGKYNAKLKLNTILGPDMMPRWESFNSIGELHIPHAIVQNFAPLQKLANELRMEEYKNIVLEGLRPSYKIEGGKFFLEPVTVKLGDSEFMVWGSNTIDRNIDYAFKITVPAQKLRQQANMSLQTLLKTNVEIPMDDELVIDAFMTGLIDNPNIRVSLDKVMASTVGRVKDQVRQEVQQRTDDARQQVNEEVDRQKQELERQRMEAEQRAREEADRIRREAEERKRQEEERLKKEAEERLRRMVPGRR